MDQANAESFIRAHFHQEDADFIADVDWNEPSALGVRVRLKAHEGPDHFTGTMKIPQEDAKQMQEVLEGLPRYSRFSAGEFQLDLYPVQSHPEHYTWSDLNESAALRSVRDRFNALAHLPYAESVAALRAAEELARQGQLDTAIAVLGTGIKKLGKSYDTPGNIDDTPMKEMSAEHSLRNGRKAEAAALYMRVLETRTALYADRYHLR